MPSGQKVGSAYVEVTPKAIGNFTSVLDKELGDGGGKGSAFGSAFSGGMQGMISAGAVAVGNILSDMVEAGASAAKQMIGDAFDGSAEFEQLAGGAQKIFDEIDFDTILTDANSAYKELNMSANEYMAAINDVGATFAQTMGDQAGYEAAKAGMQAISDYATGTGRDIGELNEKYKLITRSTSSYQSIADQFSGILPATSQDFLDQAKAAGLLEDSYEKLTDVPVAEYQQAVTAMLESGVDELGLAGNTLSESTKTVSGSLEMLKSSWADWLTSLGSDELDSELATDKLLESIEAASENALPLLVNIVDGISTALPGLVASVGPVLVPAVVTMASSVLPAVVSLAPSLMSAGMQFFGGLLQAAVLMLPQVVQVVVGMAPSMLVAAGQMLITLVQAAVVVLPQVAQTVIAAGPSLLAAGMEFFNQLGYALGQAVPMLIDALIYVVFHLPEIVISGVIGMIEAGANLFGGLIEGALGLEQESSRAGTTLATAATNAAFEASDASAAGENLVETFNSSFDFSAFETSTADAVQAATDAATAAADGSAIALQLADTTSGSIDVAAMDPKAQEMVENAVSAAKAVDVSSIGSEFSQKAAEGIDVNAMSGKLAEASGIAQSLNTTSTIKVDADVSGLNKLTSAANTVQSAFKGMQSASTAMASTMRSSASAAASAYSKLGSTITSSLNSAAAGAVRSSASIRSSIASVQSKTVYVNVARGSVQLPHFYMTGAFDAKTKSVPTVGVNWYSKGAIFEANSPGLIGIGDAPVPEVAAPLDALSDMLGLDERDDQDRPAPQVTINGVSGPDEVARATTRALRLLTL